MWQVSLPQNPQLETIQYITWSVSAPEKGALFVMAVIGLRSKNLFARTALFASMSLVPPLNIVFPFRQQGFLFGPVAVAATLSAILWGSLILIRERSQQREQKEAHLHSSPWEVFQYVWLAANSAAVTLIALFFLFRTRTALNFIFPCSTGLFTSNEGALPSPVHTTMAAGTHLLAVSIGTWIATIKSRSNQTMLKAMTIANIVLSVLFFVFPLMQLTMKFGANCASSSILIVFAPLLVSWLCYALVSYKSRS